MLRTPLKNPQRSPDSVARFLEKKEWVEKGREGPKSVPSSQIAGYAYGHHALCCGRVYRKSSTAYCDSAPFVRRSALVAPYVVVAAAK